MNLCCARMCVREEERDFFEFYNGEAANLMLCFIGSFILIKLRLQMKLTQCKT